MNYKEINKDQALSRWWNGEYIYLKNKVTGKIFRFKIEQDCDPWNPREDYDGNICIITAKRGDWNISDEGQTLERGEVKSWLDKMSEKATRGEIWWAPVYMYDHSGQSISLADFGDPWDSGICGYIWVTKEKIFKEFSDVTEENWKQKARECAEREIEVYNQYIEGDVYKYILEIGEPTNHKRLSDGYEYTTTEWEFYESCAGYYGNPKDNGMIKEIIGYVRDNNEEDDIIFLEEED